VGRQKIQISLVALSPQILSAVSILINAVFIYYFCCQKFDVLEHLLAIVLL